MAWGRWRKGRRREEAQGSSGERDGLISPESRTACNDRRAVANYLNFTSTLGGIADMTGHEAG